MRTISPRFLLATTSLLLPVLTARAPAQCVAAPFPMTSWLGLDSDAADLLRANHGGLVGTPSFVPGRVGGAVQFDGDDDAVVIAHDPSLDVTASGFCVEFWMRGSPTQPHAQFLVVDKSHGWVDSTGWLFQGDSTTGRLSFGIGAGGSGSSNFPVVEATVDVLDDAFHHVAGTWNGAVVELFVDGVSQGSTPLAQPANNTRPVRLGVSWGGGTPQRFFRGSVDELSVYPRALAAAEIAAIARAAGAGKCRHAASCTFRNGSGSNATGYACTTGPALGTTWTTTIATVPSTVSTLLALAARPGRFPIPGGEILFDPTAPALFAAGTGSHAVPIPGSVALLGGELATQGLRVDLVGGAPTLVTLNAQDIRLGF